jgi:hypothetical protein
MAHQPTHLDPPGSSHASLPPDIWEKVMGYISDPRVTASLLGTSKGVRSDTLDLPIANVLEINHRSSERTLMDALRTQIFRRIKLGPDCVIHSSLWETLQPTMYMLKELHVVPWFKLQDGVVNPPITRKAFPVLEVLGVNRRTNLYNLVEKGLLDVLALEIYESEHVDRMYDSELDQIEVYNKLDWVYDSTFYNTPTERIVAYHGRLVVRGLNGFPNLKRVQSIKYLHSMPLPSLMEVDDLFKVTHGPWLRTPVSLKKASFPVLTKVGTFEVAGAPDLIALSCPQLREVGWVTIDERNPNLDTLEFPSLQKCDRMDINGIIRLRTISFPKLETAGKMYIRNLNLEALRLPRLRTADVLALDGVTVRQPVQLPKLQSVTFRILIRETKMRTLEGVFPVLKSADEIIIVDNQLLETLGSFPHLQALRQFTLKDNPSLVATDDDFPVLDRDKCTFVGTFVAEEAGHEQCLLL